MEEKERNDKGRFSDLSHPGQGAAGAQTYEGTVSEQIAFPWAQSLPEEGDFGDLPTDTEGPLPMRQADLSDADGDRIAAGEAGAFYKGERLTVLPIDLVYGNPDQPRKAFDDAALYELAESIQQHGVFSPILVSPDGKGKYMIVAGERRYRASLLAGKREIPAIVRAFSSRQVAEIALVENLQREDLNPIEAALAMRSLMQEYRLTQEEVASRIGKSRSAVANTLRLLSLSPRATALVRAGKLSQGHARALLPLPPSVQEEIAETIVNGGLSVRETERKVKEYFHPPAEIARKKKELREAKISVELKDLVNRMQRVFKTKISVIGNDKKGRFYLDYYTRDDLERIFDLVSFWEEHEKG